LLELKAHLLAQIEPLGFRVLGPREGSTASSITTFRHETASSAKLFAALEAARVVASLRRDREGRDYLRFSPHFYNTEAEIETAVEVLRRAL
jgi:selenocysteine lyase/cysteine desulfurase